MPDKVIIKTAGFNAEAATEPLPAPSENPTDLPPRRPQPEKKHSPYLQALKAELYRCRGGHQAELQKAIDDMPPEAQRILLSVIRDLHQEAESEKSKRQRGQFW